MLQAHAQPDMFRTPSDSKASSKQYQLSAGNMMNFTAAAEYGSNRTAVQHLVESSSLPETDKGSVDAASDCLRDPLLQM